VKKLIEPYRGQLSPNEIAYGMNAAGRNAKRLLKDAKLLFAPLQFFPSRKQESWPSCVALRPLKMKKNYAKGGRSTATTG